MRRVVLFTAIAVTVAVWSFRDSFQSWIIAQGTLANDAPSAELLDEYIRSAPDPNSAILAAWNSGKIVHRQFAIRQLTEARGDDQSLAFELEGILLSGAMDPDLNVREAAFSGLRSRRHPGLVALAAAQLRDPDPQVRLLGLDYLKHAAAAAGVPVVVPLIDDLDLRVAGRAIKLLEHWSEQDFGMRLVDTVQVDNPQSGLKEFRAEGIVRTRAAAERAKEWWSRDEPGLPPTALEPPRSAWVGTGLSTVDFSLPTLEGRDVRLSDFRGRAVIINFWATWCLGCLGEIPALVELQKRHGERLAILGVSLDAVPDSHGHSHGSTHSGGAVSADHADHGHDDHAEPALDAIRAKVARMAKKLGINYTVLLDERNTVGGRFNGGELPTTLIVDGSGNICRRFVGARDLATFEAMLTEVFDAIQPGQFRDRNTR